MMPDSTSVDVFNLGDDWAQDSLLCRRLDRAWTAFFCRFGRLTDVQRAVIGEILDGHSILVCAPTAAGKTEAACAPLMERFCRETTPWTVLYISPTRALVNDLYERLSGPVTTMGLRVSRRTGDYHDDLQQLPNVLLTTPESFDSLLCRGRSEDIGHVLAHVRAVVLDEIHLMHGSARGEQLRWLLGRLRRLRAHAQREQWCRTDDLQVIGLSATVPDPDAVCASYLPGGGKTILVAGSREIELVEAPGACGSVQEVLPAYLETLTGPEKVLVFSNARKKVDALSADMAPTLARLGYSSRGHHGSLSQPEREAAERAVKTERKIVLFSTSTLEIGVDIGDIDLVVLNGPPGDMSAFLQRIGRGNRRTGKTRVMLCYESEREKLVQAAMLEAARAGYLGPSETGTCYAVARQQLASFIFQGPRAERPHEIVRELLTTYMSEAETEQLITHLVSTADLDMNDAGIKLGAAWLDATERGAIHCNIEGQSGFTVRDQRTGDAIAGNIRYKSGNQMSIAGNKLNVTRVHDWNIDVERNAVRQGDQAQWSYASSLFVRGASQPQAVRRHLKFLENEWPIVASDIGTVVFHFGGARRKAFLDLLVRRAGLEKEVKLYDYHMVLPLQATDKPQWLNDVGPATLEVVLPQHFERLERVLARPNANKKLPVELRIAEVASWLNVPAQLLAVQASRWVQVADPQVRRSLMILAGG